MVKTALYRGKILTWGGFWAIFSFPMLVLAQNTGGSGATGGVTLKTYIVITMGFINTFLIPALFAVAFILFLWGIAKFFVLSGANEEGREQGKKLAFWGVIAFVFILSIWGLVNALVAGFGIGNGQVQCPDYNKNCQSSGNTGSSGNTTGTGGSQSSATNRQDPYSNTPGENEGADGTTNPGRNTNRQTFPNADELNQNEDTGGFPIVDPPPSGGEGSGGGEG